MALFIEAPDRKRMPFGGKAADGFGQWLRVTAQTTKEGAENPPVKLSDDDPMAYVLASAARDYATTLKGWEESEKDRGSEIRNERARDNFEVTLIASVMACYGVTQFARNMDIPVNAVTSGGRPMADITAQYMRVCIILAKYIGISEIEVMQCGDDQDALMALNDRERR